MPWPIVFLVAQAVLEYGQTIVDIGWTHNWPRAIIMAGAGTSSIAMIWIK